MFVRPKNCRYCIHGFNALGHIVGYAQQKGLWNITDLTETQANQTPVYDAIDATDPFAFYGFGHGQIDRYTGDSEQDIFNTFECNKLSGRVVYLLSCLTATVLGPEIIRQGALAYAGFNISWTWVAQSENEEFVYFDPYDDPYAYGFYESANELWKALLDGKTFQESVQQSVNKYNEWIDYWYYQNPGDPASQDCIKYLALDRDGLVSLDVCDVQTNQTECEALGCYWINGVCCASQVQGGSGNLIPIVLAVGIVGVVVVSYYIQSKQARAVRPVST